MRKKNILQSTSADMDGMKKDGDLDTNDGVKIMGTDGNGYKKISSQ
jgi:hypothetical protein